MQRYLETLFRRKALFLIPFIAIPALTTLTAFYSERQYTVRASAWAENTTILQTPGPSRSLTPNETEARVLRDRLKTVSFISEVMHRTGLTEAIRAGEWPEPTRLQALIGRNRLLRLLASPLRLTPPETFAGAFRLGIRTVNKRLGIDARGNNLILVSFVGPDPELGQRIIEETLALHQQMSVDARLRESEVGVDYLTKESLVQEQRLIESDRALADFEEQFPSPPPGLQRPPEELKELQRLQQAKAIDETRYLSALDRLEDLRLRSNASLSTADLLFRVVDPPVAATSISRVSVRRLGLMAMVGLTLGLILGSVAVVFATWRDGTVRTLTDLERAIDTPLIIEVPILPSPRRRGPSLIRSAIGLTPWTSGGS